MQPFINPNYFYQNQPIYQPSTPINSINGMYVDSRSVVDATQGDLTGKPYFMPTTDGSTIYVKQLDNFGKSHITTYIKQVEEDIENKSDKLQILTDKVQDLTEKINELIRRESHECSSNCKNDHTKQPSDAEQPINF